MNWWSLKAAGFVAHPVEMMLADSELGLQGRPWRILRKGNLAIPAFVRSAIGEKLRPQQRARIDAYCHLIQLNEGAESPYGIVLDRGTFEGTAIKPTVRDRRTMTKALQQIPQLLRAWLNDHSEPRPPFEANYAPCKRCPHGRPVRYKPEETDIASTPETAIFRIVFQIMDTQKSASAESNRNRARSRCERIRTPSAARITGLLSPAN